MSSNNNNIIITSQINNGGIRRPGENQLRRQRNASRIYRTYIQFINTPINNKDTLNRIENLPRQITDDNILIHQFFNGSSFY